jgi:hypothetical protein
MDHLRIILDKSVVYGLSNDEADSLDRYFFQIIPPILMNEILADLTKVTADNEARKRLAGNSYRIGGNRGLTPDYRLLLESSLSGFDGPMDGRYLPAGERTVETTDGKVGVIVETPDEDEMILKWERGEFTEEEKATAANFRKQYERPINVRFYVQRLKEIGIDFKPPPNDDALFEFVESLLRERNVQGRLFALIQEEHGFTGDFIRKVIKRWYMAGAPMFECFAPYAFYCLRASFLWAFSSSTPGQNDRKDLEYLYHLPFTELFASKDKKHKRLVPYLLKDYQSFVPGEELKDDLARLSARWNSLSREEQIKTNAERGSAPPEDKNSLAFRLWKKHRGTISPNMLPVDRNSELLRAIRKKYKELVEGKTLSPDKANDPNQIARGTRISRKSRERIKKMFPQVTDADLDKKQD